MKRLPFPNALIAFPLLLTLGIGLIPFVHSYAAHELAASLVATQPLRWYLGHLISSIAFGVGMVAITELTQFLQTHAQSKWLWACWILTAVGAGLLAAGLGADGIGPLAFLQVGLSSALFFDGSASYIMGSFILGSVLFGLGQILLVANFNQLSILSKPLAIAVQLAAIIFAAATAVPSTWGLYILAIASWFIYLPLFFTVQQFAIQNGRLSTFE